MVTTKLNLSMTEPQVRQIYAKQGDTGRVLDITLDQTPEDGTLRILRPDGTEVTSEAVTGGEVSESGETVTFDSLTEADVTELTVGIEPVQDLNGYDAPWVGGAGKNKLNFNRATKTLNGVTFTNNGDGTYTVSGTSTAITVLEATVTLGVAQGTQLILNGCPSGGSANTYALDTYGTDISLTRDYGSGGTFTANGSTQVFRIVVFANVTMNNLVFKPMIRLATETDSTFAPYSNICPIYGGNETNLLDTSVMEKGFRSTTVGDSFDNILSASGNRYLHSGAFNATQGLSFQITSHDLDYLNWYSVNMYNNGTLVAGQAMALPSADTLYTYTVPKNTYEVVAINLGGSNVTNTVDPTKGEIQLNLGTSVLPYVPYQSIRVDDTGKNLLETNDVTVQGRAFVVDNDGWISAVNTTSDPRSWEFVSSQWFLTLKQGTYAFKVETDDTWASQANRGVRIITEQNDNLLVTSTAGDYTFTLSKQTTIGVMAKIYAGKVRLQLELGSTATAYEPYQGSTYTTSLGQTVYGGTLDMVTGQLVVDKAMVDLSTLSWTRDPMASRFYAPLSGAKPPSSAVVAFNGVSSAYRVVDFNTFYSSLSLDGVISMSTGADLSVRNLALMDLSATDFATAITGQQLVYELATPQTIQLTPQQIKTLVGTNNVWASSGDIVSITFTYGGLLSELPSEATEIVGKCYCDVEQNGVSSMPFTLNVKKNERQ